jgi:threonine synthase
LAEEQERISREINSPEGLAHALAYKAKAMAMDGKLDEALKLAEEAYGICVEHGYSVMAAEVNSILSMIKSRI